MTDFLESISMRVFMGPYVKYCNMPGNRGITAVAIIETSHIAMHIWDEPKPALLQMDVYSCGEFDHTDICKKLMSDFNIHKIEYKYLNQFYNESFGFISNFIFEKEVGKTAEGSTTFSLSNYLYVKDIFFEVSFGVLGFSEFGEISDTNTFGNQEHQYGLQFEYEFELSDSEIELALGYLHGLTDASSNHALLWNFEFEFN